MDLMIDKPGSVMFRYQPEKDPLAFNDLVDMNWVRFELNGEQAEFYSEGKKLYVVLNRGTDKEQLVLAAKVRFSEGHDHCISLSWHSSEIALFIDGDPVKFVSTSALMQAS